LDLIIIRGKKRDNLGFKKQTGAYTAPAISYTDKNAMQALA